MEAVVEDSYRVCLPFGWSENREESRGALIFGNTDYTRQITIDNTFLPSRDITEAAYEELAISHLEEPFSAKPEATETTLLGNERVTVRTYHLTIRGTPWYGLLIATGRDGIGTVLAWTSVVGHETQDRATFDFVSASFKELGFTLFAE